MHAMILIRFLYERAIKAVSNHMLLFIFSDRNGFEKSPIRNAAKRVVTFFKNESKEVLKHTVNYFKKENTPVRTIYNVIKRYLKHNSTNYLPKTGRPKKISDQELKTLVRLVDNKVGVSQRRLGR